MSKNTRNTTLTATMFAIAAAVSVGAHGAAVEHVLGHAGPVIAPTSAQVFAGTQVSQIRGRAAPAQADQRSSGTIAQDFATSKFGRA